MTKKHDPLPSVRAESESERFEAVLEEATRYRLIVRLLDADKDDPGYQLRAIHHVIYGAWPAPV